ncbi:MAG: helix-turn-helix domain-containing protein [Patescibacteria group bacterium]
MNIESILKNFGLNEKETAVYLALIELGPSPVRLLSVKSGVNRGTTYDILKSLIGLGLVSYYNKQSHQYFSAEPPDKLLSALEDKRQNISHLERQIQKELPELKSLFERQGGKPAVKLYEATKGIKFILEDVLETVGREKNKEYYVYSSVSLRKDVYRAYPTFSEQRIKKKIAVKTISLGDGGQLVGLDERKWLAKSRTDLKSTYEIIYAGKVAHISLDDTENPVGVVIQNQAIFETQKVIFESLWSKL